MTSSSLHQKIKKMVSFYIFIALFLINEISATDYEFTPYVYSGSINPSLIIPNIGLSPFTVDVFLRAESLDDTQFSFTVFMEKAGAFGVIVTIDKKRMLCQSSPESAFASMATPLGTWFQVTLSYRSSFKVYQNAQPLLTSTCAYTFANTQVYLLTSAVSSKVYLRRLRIWTTELSQSDIMTYFNNDPAVNTLLTYKLTEPSGIYGRSNDASGSSLLFLDSNGNLVQGEQGIMSEFDEGAKDALDTALEINSAGATYGPTVPVPPYAMVPEFTVEFWITVKSGSFSASNTVYNILGLKGKFGNGFELVYDTTDQYMRCRFESGNVLVPPKIMVAKATFEASGWHYLACSVSAIGQWAMLMMDLQTASSNCIGSASSTITDSDYFVFGANSGSIPGFKGYLREFRIWNTGRTFAQLKQLMHRKLNPDKYLSLVGYWKFDEGKGPNLYDYASYILASVTYESAYSAEFNKNYGASGFQWSTPSLSLDKALILCKVNYTYEETTGKCVGAKIVGSLLLHFNPSVSTNYINFPMSPLSYNSHTVELWVLSLDQLNTKKFVFTHSNSFANQIDFAGGYFVSTSGGTSCSNIIEGVPQGKWTHLSFSYSSTVGNPIVVMVNRNAASCNMITASFISTVSTLAIGSDENGANGINGFIRDFRLWGYTRTVNDMLVDMMRIINPNGLLLNYRFNEGQGKTYYDYSMISRKDLSFPGQVNSYAWEYDPAPIQICEEGSYYTGFGCASDNRVLIRISNTKTLTLQGSTSITKLSHGIEAWVYQTSIVINKILFKVRDNSNNHLYSFVITSATALSFKYAALAKVSTGPSLVNYLNKWTHYSINNYCSSTNQQTINAYQNGVLIATDPGTAGSATVNPSSVPNFDIFFDVSTTRELRHYNYFKNADFVKATMYMRDSVNNYVHYFRLDEAHGRYSIRNAKADTYLSVENVNVAHYQGAYWTPIINSPLILCDPTTLYNTDKGICETPKYHVGMKFENIQLTGFSTSDSGYMISFWINPRDRTSIGLLVDFSITPPKSHKIYYVQTLLEARYYYSSCEFIQQVGLDDNSLNQWINIQIGFGSTVIYLYVNYFTYSKQCEISCVDAVSPKISFGSTSFNGLMSDIKVYTDTSTTLAQMHANYPNFASETVTILFGGLQFFQSYDACLVQMPNKEWRMLTTAFPSSDLQLPAFRSTRYDDLLFYLTYPSYALMLVTSARMSAGILNQVSASGWAKIVSYGNPSSGYIFRLQVQSGELLYVTISYPGFELMAQQVQSGSTKTIARTYSPVPVNSWFHFACDCIDKMRVYLNGLLLGEAGASPTFTFTYDTTVSKQYYTYQATDAVIAYRNFYWFNRGVGIDYLMSIKNIEISGSGKNYIAGSFSLIPPYTQFTGGRIYTFGATSGYFASGLYTYYGGYMGIEHTAPTVCSQGYLFDGVICKESEMLGVKTNRRAFSGYLTSPILNSDYWTLEGWLAPVTAPGLLIGLESNDPTYFHYYGIMLTASSTTVCTIALREAAHDATTHTSSDITCPADLDRKWFHFEWMGKLTKLELYSQGTDLLGGVTFAVQALTSNCKLTYLVIGTSYNIVSTAEAYFKLIRIWRKTLTTDEITYNLYNDLPTPSRVPYLIAAYAFSIGNNPYLIRESRYGLDDIDLRFSSQKYFTSTTDVEPGVFWNINQIITDSDIPITCPQGYRMNTRLLICEEALELLNDMKSLEQGYFSVTLGASNLNAYADWTIHFWIKIYSATGAAVNIVTQSSGTNIFDIKLNAGTQVFTLLPARSAPSIAFGSTSLWSYGKWFHIAVVNSFLSQTNEKCFIYLNLPDTSTVTDTASNYPIPNYDFILGTATLNILKAKIREFVVWKMAVSPYVIQRYAYKVIPQPIISRHLALYYRINEGKGNTLYDLVSSARTGTFTTTKNDFEIWTQDIDMIICKSGKTYYKEAGSCRNPRVRGVFRSWGSQNTLGPFDVAKSQRDGIVFQMWLKITNPPPADNSIIMVSTNLFKLDVISNKLRAYFYFAGSTLSAVSTRQISLDDWVFVAVCGGVTPYQSYIMDNTTITYFPTTLESSFKALVTTGKVTIGDTSSAATFYIAQVKVWRNYMNPDDIYSKKFRSSIMDYYNENDNLAFHLPLDESQSYSFVEYVTPKKYTDSTKKDTWTDETNGLLVESEFITNVDQLTLNYVNPGSVANGVLMLPNDIARTYSVTPFLSSLELGKEFTIQLWIRVVVYGTLTSVVTADFLRSNPSGIKCTAIINNSPEGIKYKFEFSKPDGTIVQSLTSQLSSTHKLWQFISISKGRDLTGKDNYNLWVSEPSSNIASLSGVSPVFSYDSSLISMDLMNKIGVDIYAREMQINLAFLTVATIQRSYLTACDSLDLFPQPYLYSKLGSSPVFSSFSPLGVFTTLDFSSSLPSLCPSSMTYMDSRCSIKDKALHLSYTGIITYTSKGLTTNFAIELWVKPTSALTTTQIKIIYTTDPVTISAKSTATICQIGSTLTLTGGALTTSAWSRITCSQINTIKNYNYLAINNAVSASGTVLGTWTYNPINTIKISSAVITLAIKDIKLWNEYKPLQYMNSNIRRIIDYTREVNLISYLPLNEGDGTVIWDLVGTGTSITISSPVRRSVWVANDLVICRTGMFYDKSKNICSVIQKAVKVAATTTMTLPIGKAATLHEVFTFKFFVRISAGTITISRSNQFSIAISSSTIQYSLTSANTQVSSLPISIDQWFYISLAYSYFLQTIEILQVLALTPSVSPNYYFNNAMVLRPASVGASLVITTTSFTGFIKEISLWEKYLPETSGNSAPYSFIRYYSYYNQDLLAYYKMDESSGTSLYDSSLYEALYDSSTTFSWVAVDLPDSLDCNVWHDISISPSTCGRVGICTTSNCLQCVNINGQNLCLFCVPPLFLDSGQCLSSGNCVTPGTFLNRNECKKCRENCNVCTDLTTCQACNIPYLLNTIDGFCVTLCPGGTCPNAGNTQCYPDVGCNLISTALTDEYTKVTLTFSKQINTAKFPLSSPVNSGALCVYLFGSTLSSTFGLGYSCTVNNNQLIILLGQDATFISGVALNIIPERLFLSGCGCAYQTTVTPDATPFSINANLDSPTYTLNSCDQTFIVISSITGIGNRPSKFSIVYELIGARSTDNENAREDFFYQNMLTVSKLLANNKNFLSVTFPKNTFLASANYNIKITLQNFNGDTKTFFIYWETMPPGQPLITIFGGSPTLDVYRWQEIKLPLKIITANCSTGGGYGMIAEWSLDPSYDQCNLTDFLANSPNAPMELTITPFSLVQERKYKFIVNATNKEFLKITGSSSIILNVVPSKMEAVIANGNKEVDISYPLILNGSLSRDFSYREGEITYTWTCINTTIPGKNVPCIFLNGTQLDNYYTGATVIFPGGSFRENSTILIYLAVHKFELTDMTQATYNFTQGIIATSIVFNSLRVNQNEDLIISASVDSNSTHIDYFWQIDPIIEGSCAEQGWTSKFLKIKKYSLKAKGSYKFTCKVFDEFNRIGMSSVTLQVNMPPSGGDLKIFPSSGYGRSTLFELRADSWVDDDKPISYLFMYRVQTSKTTDYSSIFDRNISSVIYATLPNGNADTGYAIDVKLIVYDFYNGSTEVTTSVTVKQENVTKEKLLEQISQSNDLHNLSVILGNNQSEDVITELIDKFFELSGASNSSSGSGSGSQTTGSSGKVDEKKIDILTTIVTNNNISDTGLEKLTDIANSIASQEQKAISKNNSNGDPGLTPQKAIELINTISEMIKQMNDAIWNNKKYLEISNSIEILARSTLKQSIPGESTVVKTSILTVDAKKIAPSCAKITQQNTPEKQRQIGKARSIDYNIPICDMFPKSDQETAYDLIIIASNKNLYDPKQSQLSSEVLKIVLYNTNTNEKLNFSSIAQPIELQFDYLYPGKIYIMDKISCMARSSLSNYTFDTDSTASRIKDTMSGNNTIMRYSCEFSHLSEFAILYVKAIKLFGSWEFIILTIIMSLASLLFFVTIFLDIKENKQINKVLDEKVSAMQAESIITLSQHPMTASEPPTAGGNPYSGNGSMSGQSIDAFKFRFTPKMPGETLTVARYLEFKSKAEKAPIKEEMRWWSVLARIFVRTHSFLKIFFFFSPELSRHSRALLFGMKYFAAVFGAILMRYFEINWISDMALCVWSTFIFLPATWVFEYLIRYTINTSINKLAPSDKVVIELQIALNEKINNRNRIRVIGKMVAIGLLYSSYLLCIFMVFWMELRLSYNFYLIMLYQIFYLYIIHEVLATGLQIICIYVLGAYHDNSSEGSSTNLSNFNWLNEGRCKRLLKKLMMAIIYREVLEGFQQS